jgi:hypothetical protein
MGVLIAKCPVTEKEFSTGINVDQDSLVGLRAVLPHCGAEHAWRVHDARYVDASPPDVSLWSPDKAE